MIEQCINEILCFGSELDPETLPPETTLVDQLGLDSLDYKDLLIALEGRLPTRFVDIPDCRQPLSTVGDLHNFIEDHLRAQGH